MNKVTFAWATTWYGTRYVVAVTPDNPFKANACLRGEVIIDDVEREYEVLTTVVVPHGPLAYQRLLAHVEGVLQAMSPDKINVVWQRLEVV